MSCGCERWAEHLFEPEEALSSAEREGLAAHLAECEECSAEREMFLDSWSCLDDMAEEELECSPMLRARVWEKIREEECCVKPLLPKLVEGADRSWRGHALKAAAAAAAILLGFGLGRSLRSGPEGAATPPPGGQMAQSESFLDPEMIELASRDGFSMDLFPESTQFSPLDREMMSALAPAQESREWLARERGVVIPLQYISQGLPQRRGRKAR